MVLSARIAATRLGVATQLGEVRAEVSGEKAKDEPSRVEKVNIRLDIAGDLDAATKQRIVEDAEAICTVSNTLRTAPELHTTLAGSRRRNQGPSMAMISADRLRHGIARNPRRA